MNTVWALQREELWRDCRVSPDVFNQMGDRLGEFVMPSQQMRETEAGQRNVPLSLQGLLSHWLCRKFCLEDRARAVALVCGRLRQPESRTIRPQ